MKTKCTIYNLTIQHLCQGGYVFAIVGLFVFLAACVTKLVGQV